MHIKLPDDYVISERLLNASTNDIAKIITIGEFVFFEGHKCMTKELYDQKYEHLKHILEKEHIHALSIETSKTQNLVDANSSLQKSIENMRIDFDKTKQIMIDNHKEQINYYNNQIVDLQNKLNNYSADSHNLILSKMESLLGYGNTIDNIEKGNYGETYVNNHILEEFPESNIVDVSGNAASGDIIWEMQENDFKCLVEVKNVAHGKNLNVDKFVRDININSNKCIINCGLFVSLKTDNIPFKGKLRLEFINNVPVVYVSNVFKNPHALIYAMYMIKEVQVFYKNNQNDTNDDNETHFSHILSYFDKLKTEFTTHQTILDELQKNIDKTNISINKLIKNMDCIVRDHIYQMKLHNISTFDRNDKHMTKDKCLSLLIDYYQKHKKWPTGPESNISPYYRRIFKYSNLLDVAKEKYENIKYNDNK